MRAYRVPCDLKTGDLKTKRAMFDRCIVSSFEKQDVWPIQPERVILSSTFGIPVELALSL
jgi:hypothetical protein